MPMHDLIHRQVMKHRERVDEWFCQKAKGYNFPIYCSVDVRDASYKVACVDANIYPAGFNNICSADIKHAGKLMRGYLDRHYGPECVRIVLLTEEHTSNLFYWDNVRVLSKIIRDAGRDLRVCIPREMSGPIEIKTSSGDLVQVLAAHREGSGVKTSDGFVPQLILSNNDFSDAYESWAEGLTTPVNPPRELGWYQRKKSNHFVFYNELVREFAGLIEVDPWVFQIRTELVAGADLNYEDGRQQLASRVDAMIEVIRADYRARQIPQEPVVFVKNNAGTYGLAVTKVASGAEVLEWNSKARKKMAAAKGGHEVAELIIQEGIPSVVTSEAATAEPVVYMIGCDLAGAFLRTHSGRDATESLNSPGAIFKSLCMSDLQVKVDGMPMENVYGCLARMSMLAISREADQLKVAFPQYQPGCNS